MVPQWSMHPFKAESGEAIEQGSANEDSVIKVLRKSLRTMSSGMYDVYRNEVREFGLDCRRGHRYCTSSPDGAFVLTKRNSSGRYNLLGICILEMKTRGNERTTNKLFDSVLARGQFEEVSYWQFNCKLQYPQ